jgi:hypothetical protein
MSSLATFQALCQEYPRIAAFGDDVYNAILSRLGLSTSGMLEKVLFTLTPAGREIEITLRSTPNQAVKDTIFAQYFPIQPTPPSLELLQKADALLSGAFPFEMKEITNQIQAFQNAPPIPDSQTQEELNETLEVTEINARSHIQHIQRPTGEIFEDDELSISDDIDNETDDELSRAYYSLGDAIADSQFTFDDMGHLLSEFALRLKLDPRKVSIAFIN